MHQRVRNTLILSIFTIDFVAFFNLFDKNDVKRSYNILLVIHNITRPLKCGKYFL